MSDELQGWERVATDELMKAFGMTEAQVTAISRSPLYMEKVITYAKTLIHMKTDVFALPETAQDLHNVVGGAQEELWRSQIDKVLTLPQAIFGHVQQPVRDYFAAQQELKKEDPTSASLVHELLGRDPVAVCVNFRHFLLYRQFCL